jgi:hypothetical protein
LRAATFHGYASLYSKDVAGAQPTVQPPLLEGSTWLPAKLWYLGTSRAFLQAWVSLGKKTVYSWLDDRAPTIGAAIAFYTMFSLAPMLVIVVAVAGFVFGREAAEGALFGELAKLVGPDKRGSCSGDAEERQQHSVGDHRHRGRYWHINRHCYCRQVCRGGRVIAHSR